MEKLTNERRQFLHRILEMSGEARESRRVRLTVEQVFSLMQGEAVVVDGDGDGERSLTIESDVEDARVAGE